MGRRMKGERWVMGRRDGGLIVRKKKGWGEEVMADHGETGGMGRRESK